MSKFKAHDKVFLYRSRLTDVTQPCTYCEGHGHLMIVDSDKKRTCPICEGKKSITKNRTFNYFLEEAVVYGFNDSTNKYYIEDDDARYSEKALYATKEEGENDPDRPIMKPYSYGWRGHYENEWMF